MNKLTITVLLAVLATVLLAAGCGPTPTPTPPGESLEWEKIADEWAPGVEYSYKERSPTMMVVTTSAEAYDLEGRLRPDHLDLVRSMDFVEYIVIAVYQGKKGTTGYSIEVVDVGLEDNVITIYAKFLTPGSRSVTGQLVTSPYCVLRIKKTPELRGDFTFVLIANGEEIMRRPHTIP